METIEQPQVYTARESVGVQAGLCLAGGIGLILIMLALFIFGIALPKDAFDDKFLPGIIGGTSIIWLGLIARGIFLLRSVTQVIVDANGVHLQGFISRRSVRWDEIDHIQVDKRQGLMGGASQRVITLLDARGKMIAQIPETIGEFETLGNEIAERSTAVRGHSTYDTAADEQRQSKHQLRKMRLIAVLCAFLALGMGAGFIFGLNEELHLRRYDKEGVKVEATVVRRYMLRVTPYVEYSFKDEAGRMHSRSVMMKQPDWEDLVYAKTIPVEYLKSDPEWNRPVSGEDETHFGGFVWLIGAMALFFAIFTVTSFLGYDLKSEDGVTRLTRAGKTLKQWGPPKMKPTPTVGLHDESAVILEEDESPVAPMTTPQILQPPKPRGLLVLGILAIVFGSLGAGLNLLRVAILHNLSLLAVWSGVDALLAIALIVVGAGLVGMHLWSRGFGIVVAALQIVSSVASLVYLIVTSVRAPEAPGEQAMIETAARIGAGAGVVVGAIFPIVLLVILFKRSTADAMRR
jgi:hypothetical protein